MLKKIFPIITTLFFFVLGTQTFAASADIVINEIGAYEPSEHEWIEVYNRGTAPVDMTGWKFFEENTNHSLKAYRGDLIIDPGEYAIIADVATKFETDYPNFHGTIIDSSWTILKESGEPIALKDANGVIVESFTYLPASKGSLERVDARMPDYSTANWKEHVGGNTAGFSNTVSSQPDGSSGNQTNTSSTSTNQTAASSNTQSVAPPHAETDGTSASSSRRMTTEPPPTYGAGSLVINEFMPDPGEDSPEWIEIFSKADVAIDLNSWVLHDAKGKIAALSGMLFPGSIKLIELSATRLNNGGDMIKLLDPKEKIIDQVTYGDFDDGNVEDNAPKTAYPNAIARADAGVDTNEDYQNFVVTTAPTPGTPNQIVLAAAEEENIAPDEDPALEKTPASEAPARFFATSTSVYGIHKGKGAHGANASRKAQSSETLEIQGMVTAPPGVLSTRSFFMQTTDGGEEIYMYKKDFPKLRVGDRVRITGVRYETQNGTKIKVASHDDVIVVNNGALPKPEESAIGDITNDDIASFVQVHGEVREIKNHTKFVVGDADGEILVYAKQRTGIGNMHIVEGDFVTVAGIVGESGGVVHILPRFSSDIQTPKKNIIPAATSASEPITLNKKSTMLILLSGLLASGVAALIVGLKFKNAIFPWFRKQEVVEEVIDLEDYGA